MSICGLRMTNPAEEALDSGVPTAEDDDKSVWGESAKGEKKLLGWGSGWQPPRPPRG